MHELSVAQSILEIVQQSVPREELKDVRVVRMKVGALSGVVADSLDFCFSAIVTESLVARARLEIELIPFTVRCNTCQKSFTNDIGYVICPECNGVETSVVAGRELQVTEIEMNDDGEKTP